MHTHLTQSLRQPRRDSVTYCRRGTDRHRPDSEAKLATLNTKAKVQSGCPDQRRCPKLLLTSLRSLNSMGSSDRVAPSAKPWRPNSWTIGEQGKRTSGDSRLPSTHSALGPAETDPPKRHRLDRQARTTNSRDLRCPTETAVRGEDSGRTTDDGGA